jgi:hypothetical protein
LKCLGLRELLRSLGRNCRTDLRIQFNACPFPARFSVWIDRPLSPDTHSKMVVEFSGTQAVQNVDQRDASSLLNTRFLQACIAV